VLSLFQKKGLLGVQQRHISIVDIAGLEQVFRRR
jgi:hypothetical protein